MWGLLTNKDTALSEYSPLTANKDEATVSLLSVQQVFTFPPLSSWYPYVWGAQIPLDKSPWRLNFAPLHLISVGPRQRHCFMSSFWRLEFWSDYYLLGKSVYLCVLPWCYSRICCFELIKMDATENLFTKVVCLNMRIQVFLGVSGGVSVCWCFGRKWYLHLQWTHRPVISPLLN